MIAVDTSALMAILLGEPERDRMIAALEQADRAVISTGTLIELRIVAFRKHGASLAAEVDVLLNLFGIDVASVGAEESDLAHTAFVQYGKGNGHPAQLNFGDLFAYALAKSRGVPLLFKGDDFAATDIASAMAG
ncbi:MAG: twitching motility protein PilT [Erythrobacter sp. RIFCSPHIGHO2_12_FULL_63_10]|nr:MAG: twitching motility protein PilT [Erythrobacter sp. RIFCSPHIGHO2_12_FULL_63_10]